MDDLEIPPSQLKGAVQLHFHLLMRPGNLPGIGVAKPIVGVFLLPAIHDGLFEHAVLVAQAIAGCRKLHGGHRVQEAGRESAQASVAQARVRFLFDQFEPIDTLCIDRMLHNRIEQKVADIVRQRTPDKKLHREIVNALGVLSFVGLLRQHPALCKDVADGTGERLETLTGAGDFGSIARSNTRCRS